MNAAPVSVHSLPTVPLDCFVWYSESVSVAPPFCATAMPVEAASSSRQLGPPSLQKHALWRRHTDVGAEASVPASPVKERVMRPASSREGVT